MKKEKPIIFNTEMIKAIIAGNKNQTRRVIKSQPNYSYRKAHKGILSNAIYRVIKSA